MRSYNFSAGPGALPDSVIDEIRAELPEYPGLGASIMEVSHRSKAFVAIWDRAAARMKDLLGLGEDWEVLFLQGGASTQFHQVPLNLLPEGGTADYLDTGEWSRKAVAEARTVAAARGATVHVAGSSAEADYTFIPGPDERRFTPGAAYVHYTSNNTIFGTQYATEPEADAPLVCDASSDFLSRPLDTARYGLIYAGAQKNIGPAGVTAVLIRRDLLDGRVGGLPKILDYGTHAGTMFNTPPVFAIYAVDKVLAWIEAHGGLDGMAERNRAKADRLYGALDASAGADGQGFYRPTARRDSRSQMNVTFRLPDEDLAARFAKEAEAEGLLALKGYRSVGGIRASIYNALGLDAVEALVSFTERFEADHG